MPYLNGQYRGTRVNIQSTEDVGDRYAALAAMHFGLYDDDFVATVIAGEGVRLWETGVHGNSVIGDLVPGCAACHHTGWTWVNGEPHERCDGCAAGKALSDHADHIDAMMEKAF